MLAWMRKNLKAPPIVKSVITWRPHDVWQRRGVMAAGMLLVGGMAFLLGRSIGINATSAQDVKTPDMAGKLWSDDMSGRVVAYIYNNVPITRVELAEHLIARYGGERLEFLVNRKIVEKACKEANIYVTDLEVEQQFHQDLRNLGAHMTSKLFEEQVLKRYNKTVFEWKEDVIRPKIAMTKLVRNEVVVTEEDVRKGFEGRYGPKVLCRMIIYQNKNLAVKAWEKIKAGPSIETAFLAEAKSQFVPQMAATGGEIPPIHKHFGDPRIEKECFSLQKGEISQVIEMPDNTALIMLCVSHLPAEKRDFDTERIALQKEIFEIKLAEKIPQKVQQLRQAANPRYLLARQPGMEQVYRDVQAEIGEQPLYRKVEGK